MVLSSLRRLILRLRRRQPLPLPLQEGFSRPRPRRRLLFPPPPLPLLLLAMTVLAVVVVVVVVPSLIELPPRHKTLTVELADGRRHNVTSFFQFYVQGKAEEEEATLKTRTHQYSSLEFQRINNPRSNDSGPIAAAAPGANENSSRHHHHHVSPGPGGGGDGPYHNWELFAADYREMLHNLKIFVYSPDATVSMDNNGSSFSFASIFLPHPNPFHPKLGNYFSEHAFKMALLRSSLLTPRPEDAHFFFMPFSINAMRSHPRLHSDASISDFVAQYTTRISSEFKFWNASGGADHFYVCCHSVGREAASKHRDLHNNAIQITCSSSYFQRLYIAHKDVSLPQVWPRPLDQALTPPDSRNKLVFFAGRVQNSRIRQELLDSWGNDTFMDIFCRNPSFPYEEGFRRSRYCLHVKGYEVNTARVSDAIHYGCIPVLISNYYDLPFANVLDWSKFSIIISHGDIALLKKILLSVSTQTYLNMYKNLCMVRRHFVWNTTPRSYDSFYMTAYQLWLKRGLHRMSY